MSILVVDDSSVMRKIVIRSIRQAGYGDYEVEQAEDGAEGLAKAKANPPKVILSDWNMPNMSGLEFIQALRAEEIMIPFGFVTSESTSKQKVIGMAAGASFLLSKPFTADDLGDQLSRYL